MNEDESYLYQNEDGEWLIQKTPDMRDYVSPYWDETFNLSYRQPKAWALAAGNIQADYLCRSDLLSRGEARLAEYAQRPFTSFSLEYIKELQAQGYNRAPIPQVSGACSPQ